MPTPEIDDDLPEAGAAVPSGKDKISPPATGAPDPDRLTYHVPEPPPDHGTVTVD